MTLTDFALWLTPARAAPRPAYAKCCWLGCAARTWTGCRSDTK
jgi:hypothetical protein